MVTIIFISIVTMHDNIYMRYWLATVPSTVHLYLSPNDILCTMEHDRTYR